MQPCGDGPARELPSFDGIVRGRQSGVAEPNGDRARASNIDATGIVDLIKTYARQETLGPLKGAGRWLAFGAAGAFLLGLGLVIVLLGALRFVQTKWDTTFDGAWSWLPYLFVLIAAGIVLAFTFSRIKKSTLSKEPQ